VCRLRPLTDETVSGNSVVGGVRPYGVLMGDGTVQVCVVYLLYCSVALFHCYSPATLTVDEACFLSVICMSYSADRLDACPHSLAACA
jgi:hypothetical protein